MNEKNIGGKFGYYDLKAKNDRQPRTSRKTWLEAIESENHSHHCPRY